MINKSSGGANCAMKTARDISVIICTCNRADSLKITLDCLSRNDRDGLSFEVIVVDNKSTDATRQIAESFQDQLPLRYLFEPRKGTYGKSHSLNRAIDAGGLGSLVAVIDDDISPRQDWLRGVLNISNRWPDKDVFTGSTLIVWPVEDVLGWALKPYIQGWIFSGGIHVGNDWPLAEGRWFTGNHFWFRSRVLSGGRRFNDLWLTEPDFMLQLAEEGFEGVMGRDAVVGHRVQPVLLSKEHALRQAVKVGREYAGVRLRPCRRKVKQARLFRGHPLLARLFCIINGARWQAIFTGLKLRSSSDEGFARSLVALERMTTYRHLLTVAGQMEEYRVFGRK